MSFYLSVRPFFCLSVFPSLSLSVCQTFKSVIQSVGMPVSRSVSLTLSQSVRLSISQSICETINQSISMPNCQSVCQSIIPTSAHLWVSLAIHLSICSPLKVTFSLLSPSSMLKLPNLSLLSLDIDECATNSHSCDANAYCNNTIGSHNCTCNSGYTRASGQTCSGEPKQ